MQFRFSFKPKKTYVLMHKNTPVLTADYAAANGEFKEVLSIESFEHLPYSVRKGDGVSLRRLNHWFRWRGIPGYRVGLSRLLDRLGVDDPSELLSEHYALSVSDHYWIKETEDTKTYESLSFFRHSFDQDGFGKAMFSLGRADTYESALKTPNNTLAGYQKKAWFHRGSDLVLLKGGTLPYQLEPVHEKLAFEMGRRLGMDVVPYSTEIYENQVVSVCRNMLDEDTDLFTAEEVLSLRAANKEKFELFTYLEILEEHGIANAVHALDDMLVLDFLMMNTDRHNQNLGVLVDCESMEWKKAAPVFDTGTGLACLRQDEEVEQWPEVYNYRLFNSNKIPDKVVSYLISDLNRYDFSVLDDMPAYYYKAMKAHAFISGLREERMIAQCRLLDKRIRLIKRIQAGKNVL